MTGFGVDIAEALCAELRAKCIWVESSWDGMIPGLLARKFADLVVGRLDASLQGAIQASYGFLNKPVDKDYEFAGATLSDPKFFGVGDGIGVRKNDVALREDLNKALVTILANGTYARINNKYFDFDVYGAQ